MSVVLKVDREFDSSAIDDNWNEAELSDFWMCELLKAKGWQTIKNDNRYFRKEVKSSFRDRVDIVLYIANRIVACIELKKPSYDLNNVEKKNVCLKQASKYALSKYKEHHGAIVSPLGVLTNGKKAFIFDGSFRYDHVLKFHSELDLSDSKDLNEFLNCFDEQSFNLTNAHSLNSILKIPYQKCNKPPVTSADAQLSRDILKLYKDILDNPKIPDEEVAFLATISLFILAVFRDCGLYPNDRIKKLYDERSMKSWQTMIDDLSSILNSDLSVLKSKHCEQGWNFYENTSWFCVNLATFPATGLGRAYEDLLEHVSKNATSFFTPDHIIGDVLSQLTITKDKKVLDPTCGSASFLASIADLIINQENLDLEDSKKYIESKLFGVDKDWFAVQIAKMSIIAVYAKNIKYEEENANKFSSPKVNITHCNFFDYSDPQSFDIVVGNPPWGGISKELEEEYHSKIKKYKSYSDNTDICIYIVEKVWHKLAENGQFGILCKRDILEGSKHERHRGIWKKYVKEVWDYGRRHLFHNNPALTMILIGNKKKTESDYTIIPKDPTASRATFKYKGVAIGNLFDCYKGFESGADDIYRLIAQRYPKEARNVPEINDKNVSPYKVSTNDKIYFLETNSKFSKKVSSFLKNIKITKTLRKSKNRKKTGKDLKNSASWFLYQRENCLRNKVKYDGWSFVYRNGKNSSSIVIPRFIRGERCRAALIEKNSATMASLSVLTPSRINKYNIYYTLAFLNSESALNVIMNSIKIADAGKVAAFPEYLSKIKIPACPSIKLKEQIVKIAFYLSKHNVPEHIKESYIINLDEVFAFIIQSDHDQNTVEKHERTLEMISSDIDKERIKYLSLYQNKIKIKLKKASKKSKKIV